MAQGMPDAEGPAGLPPGKPLLATKFYIPSVRPSRVARPHLVERLNRGLSSRLILISAPAGYGKTSLVSEWIQSRSREYGVRSKEGSGSTSPTPYSLLSTPVFSWLSLDEGDDDPIRFLTYVAAALQRVHPAAGRTLPGMLQAVPPVPAEFLVVTLINELADAPDPLVLVLEDFQAITNPAVHETLASFLDRLPPQVHLVMLTRSDPPLPLPRLRARGHMAEIRAADLSFAPGEVAAFLNQVMGLGLTPEEIATLSTRTEGWIAGLQMAALALQGWIGQTLAAEPLARSGQKGAAAFIQDFGGSNRYILDYLVEEVLQHQPASVQAFLLQTSILERLTAPLCDAVIDEASLSSSQSILEYLDRCNLFVVPLDNERCWYRYHRLFADLLHARLLKTAPEQAIVLHHRAAEWYEHSGWVAEAIHHALAGEDVDRAARLIEQNAQALFSRGELATMGTWLSWLPDKVVCTRPWLAIYHGWVLLLTGQLDSLEPRLLDAERCIGTGDVPESRDMLGHIAAIRAYAAVIRNDVPRAIALAHQALEYLPVENLTVRSNATYTLGWALMATGDPAEASHAFREALVVARTSGNLLVAISAMNILGDAQRLQGYLRQAAQTHQMALHMATGADGRPLPIAADPYRGLGILAYEWNDLEQAQYNLVQSVELGKQVGHPDPLTYNYLHLARVLWAQGEREGAFDVLDQAEQLMQERAVAPIAHARVAACRARLWLAQGDLAAVIRWAAERGLQVDDEIPYTRETEYVILARVLIAEGKADQAHKLLARLRQATEAAGRTGRLVELIALQALALHALGSTPQALLVLAEALALAEPEGYVRTFLDEGPALASLLARLDSALGPAATHGSHERPAPSAGDSTRTYARKLLSAFGTMEFPLPTVARPETSPAASSLVEPLHERELEVLGLIAQGLSNREIADTLVIAIGTVKKHTSNIFGKLGAANRTQAVARARELGLLDR